MLVARGVHSGRDRSIISSSLPALRSMQPPDVAFRSPMFVCHCLATHALTFSGTRAILDLQRLARGVRRSFPRLFLCRPNKRLLGPFKPVGSPAATIRASLVGAFMGKVGLSDRNVRRHVHVVGRLVYMIGYDAVSRMLIGWCGLVYCLRSRMFVSDISSCRRVC